MEPLNKVQKLIDLYDFKEKSALTRLPNRAIEAFQAAHFGLVGYPAKITSARELWRYHDVMHENQFESNIRLLGTSLNHPEGIALVKETASKILQFSENYFGIRSAGKEALSRALYQFAQLSRALSGFPRPWTILEIGPGSGYLGVLLGLSGNRYVAVEASQAFFVYQSCLFDETFGDQYANGIDGVDSARISHIPWWQFCAEDSTLQQFDCATANHMLCEMTKSAAEFMFAKFHRTQRGNFFCIADTLGADTLRPRKKVVAGISARGFHVKEQQDQLWMFVRTDAEPEIEWLQSRRSFITRAKARIRRYAFRSRGPSGSDSDFEPSTKQVISDVKTILAGFPNWESGDSRFNRWSW